MAVTTPYLNATEKKHWWLTNRKVVEKYIRDARTLMATQEQSEIASALNLLDAALAIYPRLDEALELRARCLLCLRRFKEVADMLQDYIPSLKMANDESVSSDSSSQQLSREGAKLLSSDTSGSDQSFKCFSVSDLKKKVMAGLCKSCDKEGYWRYLVLGKACCHLGLMEDAMVLLQTGKRLASAAFRRESVCWSDDSFSLSNPLFSGDSSPPRVPLPESEAVTQLLAHIKLLLRRRAAALAALEAGLHSEAIRHFSKIVDGRRGAPQAFLAECYMHEACGLNLPYKMLKKTRDSRSGGQFLCRTCARLTKSKHYCGICKKVWNHSDSGSWVRCDGCKVWVHAECDKISSNLFKNLEGTDYYCPTCKAKFDFELSDSEKPHAKVKWNKNNGQLVLPNRVTVLCNGVEGVYFPSLHSVVCKCGFCGAEKQALSEWERHTGSKSRNWRTSIRVKDSMLPLEQWMLQLAEFHAIAQVPAKPKKPSLKERKQKLLTFLQEKYEPVYAKWTTERCAVCRWVEDWDYNKIIICIRCQIAVHQECYGARNVRDFTSWVCKACETPHIKRECCLCPVKGGALKPTDVDTLWVHVTCAWFRPEVSFASDEKMEPALGILSIPSNSFVKICVICKQIHGSCTQCCKCSTYFHAMCASRAGYRMELHCLEKNGRQTTKMVSYCAYHRAPNPDTVLIMQTPLGVISTKSLLQTKKKTGSRLISSNRRKQDVTPIDNTEHEPFSAARCRIFQRTNHTKKRAAANILALVG